MSDMSPLAPETARDPPSQKSNWQSTNTKQMLSVITKNIV